MPQPSQAVLYMQNTFDLANPNQDQISQMVAAANQINTLGYTTVILGQWHVHPDGSMYYNNSTYNEVINKLKVLVTALKMGRGSVQRVLVTFGPFGSDFDNIAANLPAFQQYVNGLRVMADIDGVDWDLEQEYTSAQANLLVELTQWATGEGMIVTAAPYELQDTFWNPILSKTNTATSTGFSWWNLQCYGGASYSDWVNGLGSLVPNPQSFLVPGWSAEFSAPSDLQSQLAALKQESPDLTGAFLWQYELASKNGHTPAEYLAAILAGLQANPVEV